MKQKLKRLLCDRPLSYFRHKGGQVLIFASISLPVLIGFGGLGIDAVSWFVIKRQLQTAADAGALAGAYTLAFNGSYNEAETATKEDLSRNGFDLAAWKAPEINNPPTSGAFAGDSRAFEVIVERSQSLPFSSFFLSGPVDIQARAVARRVTQGKSCLLSLDEKKDKALEFTGSALVTLGCGIASNSDDQQAVYIGGSSEITASPVSSVGNIDISGSATLNTDVPLQPLAPPQEDPYEYLTVAGVPSTCLETNLSVKDAQTLDPGKYCNGIKFNAGANATLNPGTYYIDGGEFNTVGGAQISGSGVTLVLTGSGNDYAEIHVGGGTDLNLTAPTEGSGEPYPGMLVFQDPNAPSEQGANIITNKILGSADSVIQGVIYFPKQHLEFTGGSTVSATCLQIIGKTVSVTGNAKMGNEDCAADSGVKDIEQTLVLLVE